MAYRIHRGDDHAALVALQVASWRQTYRGDLPDRFLDDDAGAAITARWRDRRAPHWLIVVAEDGDGALAGFAAVDTLAGAGPYLDNLHVGAAARGRGLGRGLMRATAAELVRRGHATLDLTVMSGNARARRFYRALGGIEGPDQDERLFGYPVTVVPVRFPALGRLSQGDAADEATEPA